MNCPYCSAPLMIEDEVCRYCGKENPYFTQHRADMREFQEEFEETQQEVIETAKRTTRFTANIAAVCILIILNLLVILGHFASWELKYAYETWLTNQNEAEIRATLEAYSDAGDLLGMEHYYGEAVLGYQTNLSDYDAVDWALSQYLRSYEFLLYLSVNESSSYLTTGEAASYLSSSLGYFYQYTTQTKYDDPAEFSEEHLATINQAKAKLEAMIARYLNIPISEIPALIELSEARRAVAIEEGVLSNETTLD